MSCLDRAEAAEALRHHRGEPAFTEGGTAHRQSKGHLRDQLLGLLKAFTDASYQTGGLPVDGYGVPADLPGLCQRGKDNARAGNTHPRMLSNLRRGEVVDAKLANGALLFFRLVLQRPGLSLDQIGAVDTQRLQALQQVQSALHQVRDRLPADLVQGLFARAEEAAGYAMAQDQVEVHYEGFEPFVDDRGVHRLRVQRSWRYRPLRLSPFPCTLQPTLAYEWYEWQRVQRSTLCIRMLDEQGGVLQEFHPELHKRLDEQHGIVVIEVVPQILAELRPRLEVPPAGLRGHSHELLWQTTLVCNRADRDIVVSYQPVNALRIRYTPSPQLPDLVFTVGDSPGLRRDVDGWRLDRTLLPREVLAVRFRDPALDPRDATGLSPSGEWRGRRGLADVDASASARLVCRE